MGMKRRMALLLALLLFGMLGALAENDLVLVDVDLDPEEPGINEEALDFVLDDPDLSLDMSLEIDDMEDPPLDLSDMDQNSQVELSETGRRTRGDCDSLRCRRLPGSLHKIQCVR